MIRVSQGIQRYLFTKENRIEYDSTFLPIKPLSALPPRGCGSGQSRGLEADTNDILGVL